MNATRISIAAFLLCVCTVHIVHANTTEEMLKLKLSEKFKDIRIQQVNPSTFPGLYEVVTPNEIVYIDAKGEHLIMGQIMKVATKENLTQQRWDEINKVDFSSLPLDEAIKIVKGKGSRRLAVFSDPFCPYCQELENTLAEMDDFTLYIFLYPLESLHPGASQAARDIWCAKDRREAWANWMVNRKAPTENDCGATPLEQLATLGNKLGIQSTPTLFFPDGSRIPGAIAAERLEKKLSDSNK